MIWFKTIFHSKPVNILVHINKAAYTRYRKIASKPRIILLLILRIVEENVLGISIIFALKRCRWGRPDLYIYMTNNAEYYLRGAHLRYEWDAICRAITVAFVVDGVASLYFMYTVDVKSTTDIMFYAYSAMTLPEIAWVCNII